MKYAFNNIFITQKEKCENTKEQFTIYSSIFIGTIHNSYNLSSLS